MADRIFKFPDWVATELVTRLRGVWVELLLMLGTAKNIPSTHSSKGCSADEMATVMTDAEVPCPASNTSGLVCAGVETALGCEKGLVDGRELRCPFA